MVSSFIHINDFLHFNQKSAKWNMSRSISVSKFILSCLETCGSMAVLKKIHAKMIITALTSDDFASSRLIAFCSLSIFGNPDYSFKILLNIDCPNVFSWNMAMRGYSEGNNSAICVVLYKNMLEIGGSRPDNYSYPLLLKSCARSRLIRVGHGIMGHVFQLGFDSDIFVHNSSIHMLISCGEIIAARQLFERSSVRDLVSWNSLINGCAQSGRPREAIMLYEEMEGDGIIPDDVTMIGVISACSKIGDLVLGKRFHHSIMKNGPKMRVSLMNALLDMHAKCGNMEDAHMLFENMRDRTVVSWTTMVAGYAKSGSLNLARIVFDAIPEKGTAPCNAMISGYVQSKEGKDALTLFNDMLAANISPDEVTMVVCLSACSQLGALDTGIWIHHLISKHGLCVGATLGTALVDMYAKCGNITMAVQIFEEITEKNTFTWTSIISGFALHGCSTDAICYFEEMIGIGLPPDEITFLGVLSACCHGGLVLEGRKYFAEMRSKFGLYPTQKHYSCMVDLLGRAGLLEEAEELVMSMAMEPDVVVWGALFFACRNHGNIQMGVKAAMKLVEMEPNDSGIYVLLASMYREAEMWEEAEDVKMMMEARRVERTPGCSSIEVNGVVYEFVIGDRSHKESKLIYECLNHLAQQRDNKLVFP